MINTNLKKDITNGKYEVTENGLYVPAAKVALNGVWKVQKNDEPWEEFHNVITTEGNTKLLDVMFHNDTQITSWFISIYINTFTPTVDLTSADIGTTIQETSNYVSSTRPEWDEAAASSGSITDNTITSFAANDTITVRGAFLTSSAVKGANTGTLFSCANFSSIKTLDSSDILNVSYTINAQDVSV